MQGQVAPCSADDYLGPDGGRGLRLVNNSVDYAAL